MKKHIVLNLAKKMQLVIPEEMIALMKRAGALSDSLGFAAFAVGGLVRDLMLGVRNLDLDIVTEGDAIKLGHLLARELKAAIVVHKKFGTCSIITKDRLKIDLATARKETYGKPGALPTVKFSSIKDDLIRRDFTINAMAIGINRSSFGQLIDLFNGERDLAHGNIKVLHDSSFIDDPTRIFRAVRFESRFGFVIDRHTKDLVRSAIKQSMFDKVSRERIRDELILILQEPEPLRALRRMAELEELRFIHSAIKLDRDVIRLCDSIDDIYSLYERSPYKKRAIDKWLMYFMALFEGLTYGQVSAICSKFVLRGSDSLRLLSYKKKVGAVTKLLSSKKDFAPSRVYKLLEPLSLEVILLIMARTALMDSEAKAALVNSRIKTFLKEYSGIRLHIRGDDLKAMGLKSGPAFKAILDNVLYNKIDGKLKTKRDELAHARVLTLKRTR